MPASKPAVRLAKPVALALLLSGCALDKAREASRPTEAAAASPAAEARVSGAADTIDPAYTVAPEERAQRQPSAGDFSKFSEQAAELAMRRGETGAAAAHLSKLYEERPGDRRIAYDYARHLRYLGATTLAEKVLNDGLAAHPQDRLLRLELGKLLIGAGRPSEAVGFLSELNAERPNDPAVLQALGVAHDRRGEHRDAQAYYVRAMGVGRPSAALLNNAGLSHLLSAEPEKAVALLRKAAVAPGANAQVRQNLALALTLAGDAAAAKRFAEEGAPPEIAQTTLDAARGIRALDHPWSRAVDG